MASAGEVDDSISSEYYPSVAIRPGFKSALNEQFWWMYPIAKFFGHALYGNLRRVLLPWAICLRMSLLVFYLSKSNLLQL